MSKENIDRRAEIMSREKPRTSPQREIANGRDRAPPPIIVEIRLNIPTLADCRRDLVSNAEGVIHSGEREMDGTLYLAAMLLVTR